MGPYLQLHIHSTTNSNFSNFTPVGDIPTFPQIKCSSLDGGQLSPAAY